MSAEVAEADDAAALGRVKRKGLRVALAVSAGLTLAVASGEALPFLAPLFAAQFLLAGFRPLPATKAIGMIVLIAVAGAIMQVATILTGDRPPVFLVVFGLIYFLCFYAQSAGKGGSAVFLILVVGVMVPMLTILNVDLGDSVLMVFVKGVTTGVVLAWLAHAVLPDSGDEDPEPQAPEGRPNVLRRAFADTLILLTAMTTCLISENLSTAMVVPITVASLLSQLDVVASRRAAAGLVVVNLLGGLTGSFTFLFYQVRPSLWFFFLLVLFAGLAFGGRAALPGPQAKLHAGALTIFLVVLGLGISPLPGTAADFFATRIGYILIAISYTILMAALLWPRPGAAEDEEHHMKAVASRAIQLLIAACLLLCVSIGAVSAQAEPPAPPPAKAEQLLDLLADPEVKAWLEAKAPPAAADSEMAMADQLGSWETALRNRIAALGAAIPRVPEEFARAWDIARNDMNADRPGRVLFIVLVLIGVGYAAEYAFRRLIFQKREAAATQTEATGVSRALSMVSELIPLVVFALASAGLFVLFDWPPMLRRVVLILLATFIIFRLIRILAGLYLIPHQAMSATNEAASLHEMGEAEARFWHTRVSVFSGIFLFGWAVVSVMPILQFSDEVSGFVAYTFGLGLLATAVETVWRRPQAAEARRSLRQWLLTFFLVFLWLLWVAGMTGLLWIGIYGLVLPKVVAGVDRATQSIMGQRTSIGLRGALTKVLIGRGARALVIVAALAWLATVWRLAAMAQTEGGAATLIVNGVINTVVVLLVADLV